ncbi:MAG: hypothetical protein IAE79_26080 [Anaerolinea sp.]|nr:hypothetical protein [Anaerolinea sp.]
MNKRPRKSKKPPQLKDLAPGIRMKGGVRFDPTMQAFVAIVHTWDNLQCQGEPQEWRSPQVFPTEEAAMQHYKSDIRPILEQMMAQIAKAQPDKQTRHRRLEP